MTAYEMRISDWSSDVCSSDLILGLRSATRQFPTAVLDEQRKDTLGKVTEAVRQFGIGPCYNGFVAIAPILSEGDFPEQEIAQLIDAERCRQFKRIRDIADRFRHFFSSVEEKAVAEHLAGQR